ncbi:glycoside hydrolase family 28 protein [Pedobacter alpinus]|uniref:Glycoside hydrolase family 28 protein n=1 Tax=Pedobacter alpinus TaxID=1590643 RepID=A0ABW5TRE5_9SPHI
MEQRTRNFRNIGLSLCFFLVFCLSAKAQKYFNVMDYGAKNDSTAIATKAIEKAISAAVKVGGGTIYFGPGKYLTGPIHLKNNITILIDAGAELHFSDNFDDYLPMVPSRWEGTTVNNFSPLFYAYKAENIAITGRGLINGHGKKWWAASENFANVKPQKYMDIFHANNKNVIAPDLKGWIERGFLRPPFIQTMFCKNVLIQGITIINSPFWTVNPQFCENVSIQGVTIENPPSPNTDGINPESCKYVHISDCHISVGDDCITIKSGKDRDGRKWNAPAENYTITNTTMLSGHGGVVIGSEMSGGVKKIVISNCVFDGTDRGIRIKTARGRGGVVEDIRVSNIIMKNIKQEAIVLNMQYAKTEVEPVSERTPIFRNIHFSNITGVDINVAGKIIGIGELPVDQITFNDIQLDAKEGFSILNAKNIEFHQVTINTTIGSSLKTENVNRLEINGFKTNSPLPNSSVISLKNTSDVFIHNSWPKAGSLSFVNITGSQSSNFTIKNNNFKDLKTPVQQGIEVKERIVFD